MSSIQPRPNPKKTRLFGHVVSLFGSLLCPSPHSWRWHFSISHVVPLFGTLLFSALVQVRTRGLAASSPSQIVDADATLRQTAKASQCEARRAAASRGGVTATARGGAALGGVSMPFAGVFVGSSADLSWSFADLTLPSGGDRNGEAKPSYPQARWSVGGRSAFVVVVLDL